MKSYYETAMGDKVEFFESDDEKSLRLQSESAYNFLKFLKNAKLMKRVVCIRGYNDDNKLLFQFGPM
jgi:hypothetical protein